MNDTNLKPWNEVNRPTAAALKKLIGKSVAWKRFSWSQTETFGKILAVQGKNVQLEDGNGSSDWFWYGADGFSFESLRAAPEKDIAATIGESYNVEEETKKAPKR